MVAAMKLIRWLLSAAVGRRRWCALIVAEARAARAQHVRLERRHAGDVTQHPVHDGGAHQRGQPQGYAGESGIAITG